MATRPRVADAGTYYRQDNDRGEITVTCYMLGGLLINYYYYRCKIRNIAPITDITGGTTRVVSTLHSTQ